MIPTLFEMSEVTKYFGKTKAIDEISLSIKAGEIVALLGSNGAGKTTLVNLAAGQLMPNRGYVRIFGKDASHFSVKEKRRVLPQELSFPKNLTTNEVLNVVYAHFPNRSYIELAKKIGLDSIINKPTGFLSGGERRKLALLCSLAGDPSLVLMDEPTANIDLQGQEAIHRILKERFSSRSSSLIFSSHQMNEVETIANRVVVIRLGRVIFDGSVQEIKSLRSNKKVRFRSKVLKPKLNTAEVIKKNHDGGFECLGTNSDEILRELIETKSLNASHFEILEPTLDESIMKLWSTSEEST